MALQHIAPIVVLVFHLYGLSLAGDLPKLANNKLLEGKDRELPDAKQIDCGGLVTPRKVTTKTYKSLSEAFKHFGNIAFTSGPMGAHNGPSPGEKKYKFAEFHGDRPYYALAVDPSGELAYWLSQGGCIDIPQHPDKHEPQWVMSADFGGCSWTVTPMHNGKLRICHVEGTKEHEQFNKLSEAEKGGPVSYGVQFINYGFIFTKKDHHPIRSPEAYMIMHYHKNWEMHVQRKSCCPSPGGYMFNDHHMLTGLIMNEAKKTPFPAISGTLHFTVPNK